MAWQSLLLVIEELRRGEKLLTDGSFREISLAGPQALEVTRSIGVVGAGNGNRDRGAVSSERRKFRSLFSKRIR